MASFINTLLSSLLQSCLPQQDLVVNGRRLKVIRRLAEGGFSFVYECKDIRDPAAAAEAASAVDGQDDDGDELVAVKLMISQSPEQRQQFRREIETHLSLSAVTTIAPLLDHAFLKDGEGGPADFLGFYRSNALPGAAPSSSSSERAILIFPFYRHGSLQDFLNKRLATGRFMEASSALRFIIAVGEAVEEMEKRGLAHRDICPRNIMIASTPSSSSRSTSTAGADVAAGHDLAAASAAIAGTGPVSRAAWGCFRPVLIDLGSAVPARVEIKDRTDALRLQEEASVHSSMPYRSPELFEPPAPPSVVDGRVDVFSLAATLFALVFGYSPFESELIPSTGTLRIAEPSHLRTIAPVPFPVRGKWGDDASNEALHSAAFKGLILLGLEKDHIRRPTIAQWLEKARELKAGLS